jgi:hypothetical protein
MKVGLWGYIKAAFNARPLGMFVPPNWVGVVAFALLGILNPGFWAIGAGLELAYLFVLSNNKRFQNAVDAQASFGGQQESADKLKRQLAQLIPPERARYDALERRCQAILQQQQLGPEALRDLASQGEGLGRLLWIYLRLLLSRQAFRALLEEAEDAGRRGGRESLERQIQRLQRQLEDPPPEPDDLRKSLESQVQILQQRLDTQREAREKLAFLDAEIARVEQQVELIREQAVLTHDPSAVSRRIDEIGATLSGTSQWMRDQQQAYGAVADVLEEPPPLVIQPAGRVAE